MRLLLDAHVFLWMADEPARLSKTAMEAIRNQGNQLHLSVGSIREIQIKSALGRMSLGDSLRGALSRQWRENGLRLI